MNEADSSNQEKNYPIPLTDIFQFSWMEYIIMERIQNFTERGEDFTETPLLEDCENFKVSGAGSKFKLKKKQGRSTLLLIHNENKRF